MNQCCRISIIQEFLSSIYRRLLPGPWHSFRVICLLVYNSLIIIHSQLLFNCCCRSKIGRYELFLYSTLHISQNCSSWQRRDNPQQGTDTRASRRLLFASSTAYFWRWPCHLPARTAWRTGRTPSWATTTGTQWSATTRASATSKASPEPTAMNILLGAGWRSADPTTCSSTSSTRCWRWAQKQRSKFRPEDSMPRDHGSQ